MKERNKSITDFPGWLALRYVIFCTPVIRKSFGFVQVVHTNFGFFLYVYNNGQIADLMITDINAL